MSKVAYMLLRPVQSGFCYIAGLGLLMPGDYCFWLQRAKRVHACDPAFPFLRAREAKHEVVRVVSDVTCDNHFEGGNPHHRTGRNVSLADINNAELLALEINHVRRKRFGKRG